MANTPFYKQPQEIIPIQMDFTYYCNTTETITSISATATSDIGVDVTSSIINSASVSNNIAKVVVQNGTVDKRYKITFRAYTDESNKYEEDVFMDVVEI